MSTWGVGDKHDSEQVRTLKDQVRSQDAAHGTLQGVLLKREAELSDLRETFNNALTKLRQDADRIVQLEADLKRRNEELSNERLTRANVEVALITVERKLKESQQTTLELQSNVDTLSSNVDSSNLGRSKLQSDNAALQTRVCALERELQNLTEAEAAALQQSRGQSASARHHCQPSDTSVQIPALEKEAAELRTTSAHQASELQRTTEQLTRARDALVQLQNEKTATERQLQRELQAAQVALGDCEEDLRLLKDARGGEDAAAREAGLLERLEEEEERVAVLESELARSTGSRKRDLAMLQDELERTTRLLDDANRKAASAESQLSQLARERELAVHDRAHLMQEQDRLSRYMHAAETRIGELEFQLSTSTSPIEPKVVEETAVTIDRLLQAIARLREERNGLRRDLEFLNAENRFAVQALEEKLAVATSVPVTPAVDAAYVSIIEGHARAFQEQAARSERAFVALAIVAQHAADRREVDEARIQELLGEVASAHDCLQQAEHALDERQSSIASLEKHLTSNMQTSEAIDSQAASFRLTIQRLEDELLGERNSHAETGVALSDTEAQLTAVSDALAEAEAARDALALEKAHLETDLEAARNELADAEERYGEQLTSLSAAAKSGHGAHMPALKAHIQELEERVVRRTEQIGLHQHDIKRLEVNMKLQEERITEMTQELEVHQSEKTAMLEDCRTTREERDDAMRRYDELEEAMETLETVREREVEGMVYVTFGAMAAKRNAVVQSSRSVEANQHYRVSLEENIQALESAKATLTAQVAALTTERDHLTQTVADNLTSAQTQLEEAYATAQTVREAKSAVDSQLASLRDELEQKSRELVSSLNQLAVAQADQADRQSLEAKLFVQEKATLEEQLQESRTTRAELEALHLKTSNELERVEQDLKRAEEELASQIARSATQSEAEERLRKEIVQVRKEHAEGATALEEQLKSISDELEVMTRLRGEAGASREALEEELSRTKQQLEAHVAEASEKLDIATRLEAELEQLKVAHDEERKSLQDVAATELQEVARSKAELEDLCKQAIQESQVHAEEVSEARSKAESLETQLAELRVAHKEEMQGLKQRLEGADRDLRQVQATADAQQREAADELARTVEELKGRLAALTKEADEFREELDEEKAAHARTRESATAEYQQLAEMRNKAEAALEQAEKELPTVRAELEDVESSLRELEEEKLHLQYQVTNLEAEVQRAKSLERFLESQVAEGERHLSTLEGELAELRTKHTALDKLAQTREANFAMQTIQHDQAVASLRRELNVLRTQPSAEDEIVELKEKNAEYEELLRAKCLEIEENDDKFIDMLKEKKKLNSKVDSLTRKVQNLQAQLVAATEASAKSPVPVPAPHSIMATASKPPTVFSPTPLLAPAPVINGPSPPNANSHFASRQRVVTAPAIRSLDNHPVPPSSIPNFRPKTPESRVRMMSGPSSLGRPKTPDSRVPVMPSFKVRTPEGRRDPLPIMAESSSSGSLIGVKRRAPDDFDDCAAVPAQTFTPDSEPSAHTANLHTPGPPTTPRLRKALQTVRSGFTPVRHHPNSRAGSSSPRRATTGASAPAPLPQKITDVTNSPRGASQSETTKAAPKRGWLGKIKSGPSQNSRTFATRQPLFDPPGMR